MPYTTLITGAGLDLTLLDSLIDITTSLLGLFSIFPLNIFLIASLAALGIGLFTQMRHAA